jgi:DNA-binding NtrC family response regulator
MESKNVILVGIQSESCGPEFLPALLANGFNLIHCDNAEGLPDLVQERAEATIVVYNKAGDDTARRVLASLSAAVRHIPVIVLVDRTTFEEYYDFMCQGAFDYFELTEDPVAIERALRYASRSLPRPATQPAAA